MSRSMALFALSLSLLGFADSAVAVPEVQLDGFPMVTSLVLDLMSGGLGLMLAVIALVLGAMLGITQGRLMAPVTGIIIALGYQLMPWMLGDLVADQGHSGAQVEMREGAPVSQVNHSGPDVPVWRSGGF